MNMLAIDTSNQVMGLALMKEDVIAAELMTNIKKDHSSRLMPAIVAIMEKVHMAPGELDQIIVANGPGSYTGTRIGVTTAKTLAWALHIPVITVSSLEALAINGVLFDGYICPFFDARRQTVFTGLYQWDDNQLQVVKPEVNILMEEWLDTLKKMEKPILFLSPDVMIYKNELEKLPLAVTLTQADLMRPGNLFAAAKDREPTPAHQVAPNYLRITEAEANWLKAQKGVSNDG